jgi:hypothetical protein
LELWLIKKKGNILATSLERNLTETLNNEFWTLLSRKWNKNTWSKSFVMLPMPDDIRNIMLAVQFWDELNSQLYLFLWNISDKYGSMDLIVFMGCSNFIFGSLDWLSVQNYDLKVKSLAADILNVRFSNDFGLYTVTC